MPGACVPSPRVPSRREQSPRVPAQGGPDGRRARGGRGRALVATALLTVLVTVLAACGGSAAGEGGAGPIPVTNPYGSDVAAEGTPKDGGVLVLGTDREAVSFDPTVQNTNNAAFAVYDSLMKLAPDGSAQPLLAKGMATTDNGRTWRLELREGVTFSDGTPLNADAVIVNTRRHVEKVRSAAHSFATQIETMTALDPLTVQFTLKAPLGDFPVLFAQNQYSGTLGLIVSPAALAKYGDDIGSNPVGAGPFVLKSWTRDSKMVLARNPTYWQPGLPHLDGLEFRPLSDTNSRQASIQNGDVDLAFGAYNQELVAALDNPNLQVFYGPGNSGEFLIFNMTKPPFDDRNMREAIVRAINLQALSASQYNNRIVPADSLFDAQSPFHTDAASKEWPAFDLEKAKQLVADYRASGKNPDFTFKTSNSRPPYAEFVQAQIEALGIKVDVQMYDLAQYSASVVQSGDFQLSTNVASVDYPYPGVRRLFGTGGSTNFGKYSDPQVDALLADAASTTDDDARARAYQQVELIVNKDIPVAWTSRVYLATIAKKEVKGIDRYQSRDLFLARTWLDR